MITSCYRNKRVEIIEWIFLYLSITDTLAFCQGDTTLKLSVMTPFIISLKYLLLLSSFILISRFHVHLNYRNLWLPILLWLVHFISSLNGQLYFSPLNVIILCTFCILPFSIMKNIFLKYRIWIIIMSACSILAYLSFILSLGLPYTITEYYNLDGDFFYVDFLFSILYLDGIQLRLCGLFNEPGYFGTILALILIVENCDFRKKGNLLMLLTGILTFSLAFYLLLAIFFLVRMIKSVSTIIVTISLFYFTLNYIQNTRFEDPKIQYIANRFKFDKTTGELTGDNRTDYNFDLAYERMFMEGNWLLGNGLDSMKGKDFSTLSYKSLIYKHGVLGFVVIVGSMFMASYPLAKRNKNALIFLLCYFISIYQRPNIYTLAYFCILFGGLSYLKLKNVNVVGQ